MVNNFEIKKTNFVSILGNDLRKTGIFQKWIIFLNEHSIVRYALTANVQINSDLIQYVTQNSYISNEGDQLGIEFIFGEDVIRISEDDLNEHLHLPRDNFVDVPDSSTLFDFFVSIQATLENGQLPAKFYRSHLPKEWNLFFGVISQVFSSKISSWVSVSGLVQKIGFSVANNLRINYGRLMMKKLQQHINTQKTIKFTVYPRFLQIVLNSILSEEQRNFIPMFKPVNPPVMPTTVAVQLKNKRNYPNNNGGIPNVFLTPYLTESFVQIEADIIARNEEIQAQEHMDQDPVAAFDAEQQHVQPEKTQE